MLLTPPIKITLTRPSQSKILWFSFFAFLFIITGCTDEKPKNGYVKKVLDPKIAAVFHITDSLFDGKQAQRAMRIFDSVSFHNFKGNERFSAEKYAYLARIYCNSFKDYDNASLYLDSLGAIVFAKNSKYFEKKIAYYLVEGKIAAYHKNYKRAYSSFYEIKQLLDLTNNNCSFYTYYNNLGDLLWQQMRYEDALYYWKKGASKNINCSESDSLASLDNLQINYDNIGIAFEKLGQLDSAVCYYNNALAINAAAIKKYDTKQDYFIYRGIILGNLGGTLLKLNKLAEAEPMLIESIEINDQDGYEQADALLTKIKLAKLYLLKNNLSAYTNLLVEIEKSMQQLGGLLAQLRLAQLKQNYYEKHNDYKLANHFLKLYHSINDSINYTQDFIADDGNGNIKEYVDMDNAHQYELLKQQNQTRNLILYVVLSFLIMLMLIIFIIKRNQLVTNRQNIELTRLNQENKRTNLRLSESMLSLQNSYDENNQILKTVAHDLRSPIAGIMSLVRLMKYDENLSREELAEFIEMVEKSGNNALEFIEDLLIVNKSSTITKTRVDIFNILESCVQIAKVAANIKNQKISLNASSQYLQLNEPKIWRVFNNLLSNAIKFSKVNSIITVNTETTPTSIIISVIDYGIGIPDELKPAMFSAYANPGRAGTTGEASFGLGLSISRQIVVAHGGKIWFTSEKDKGTTFFVELPLV